MLPAIKSRIRYSRATSNVKLTMHHRLAPHRTIEKALRVLFGNVLQSHITFDAREAEIYSRVRLQHSPDDAAEVSGVREYVGAFPAAAPGRLRCRVLHVEGTSSTLGE